MKTHILSNLPKGHPWAEHIHYNACVGSTNDQAKAFAQQGVPEGTVCIAGSQTGGRGRMGRSFHSPEGKGIYLSVVLRPNCPPTALMHLTCAAAEAMCDAVENTCKVRPQIKWTNDLVLGGKKFGGILTELSVSLKTGLVDYAIIGVGINCLQDNEDFPADIKNMATSLLTETGKAVSPALLAAQMILSLEEMSGKLLNGKESIMAGYRADCMTLGRQIRIVRADDVLYAKAMDIGPDGELISQLADGTITAVSSGEVSVRGMYGYL